VLSRPSPLSSIPSFDAGSEDLATITPAVWRAVLARNDPPRLFRFGAIPSRLEEDDNGAPALRPLTPARARHEMVRSAHWFKWAKRGGESVELASYPSRAVVDDFLATPNSELPVLTRIVQSPTFAPDGTLHREPGYNASTKVFYHCGPGFEVPTIAETPRADEVANAVQLLSQDLLGDFPFVGAAEKATALAALILPFVRDMIPGPTPIHLLEKSTPGTGATLLADCLTFPALGRPLVAMTEGRDEDEWRKRLLAKLRGAPAAVNIDNVRRPLDSAALSSVLTAYPLWEDRLLGMSEIVGVPVRCLWLVTGNNPSLSNEVARRTIRCRLDAKTDRPWLRTGFRHPDIRAWMVQNRGRLVGAILTIVRAWLTRGRPEGKRILGMFEAWSRVMGGLLENAGVPGFLEKLDEFYEQTDPHGACWRAFVLLWWEKFADGEKGVADLWPVAQEAGLDLGDGQERSQRTRLGKMLGSNRDRVFDLHTGAGPIRLRVEKAGTSQRAALWTVRRLK